MSLCGSLPAPTLPAQAVSQKVYAAVVVAKLPSLHWGRKKDYPPA
jgi:hypothetical protein